VLIVGGNQSAAGGYEVDNSCRFNDGSNDNLARTPSSTSNQKTWTWSGWVKRASGFGTFQVFFGVNNGVGDSVAFELGFDGSNRLVGLPWNFYFFKTDALFRDPSAWYHIVFAFDTTQATSTNRFKVYVNGEQVTSFNSTSYPGLNTNWVVNTTASHRIGIVNYISAGGLNRPFDGYIAEAVLVDGQQLDPTSFGEFDEDSGIWKPIDVSGLTFGTNGFYLDFEDSGALGDDVSGNGNNFTVNNLTSIDQSTDTPTNNFCTLNPLNFGSGSLSEGNLKWAASGSAGYLAFGTIGIDMGVSNQFYWETKIDSIGTDGVVIGIAPTTLRWNDTGRAGSYGYYSDGNKYIGTSASSYGASFTTGDTIGVLAGNGTITFYKNGASQGTAFTGLSGTYLPFLAEVGQTNSMNFGSPPYTISSGNSDPAGYGNFEYSTNGGYALNTKNLAEYG